MDIQLVVFDIAGTTVADKGDVAGCFITAFKNNGFDIPAKSVNEMMGFRKIEAIKRLMDRYYPKEASEVLVEKIHTDFINAMVSFYDTTNDLHPLQNVEETFRKLKEKNIAVALNTGFTRKVTDTILQRLGWENGIVDMVVTSDEVPEGRPAPYMIRSIMDRLHIHSPKNVMKVGDTEVDIKEGRNAGCGIVVGVTTGSYTRQELETYNPDYIIDNLKEVLTLIN